MDKSWLTVWRNGGDIFTSLRLALIPAEYVGDEFMVRVVEFPGEGNSISVGGMYDATPSPRQAGEVWLQLWHSRGVCFKIKVVIIV